MTTYRIRNWDKHFEVSQTRKCLRATWVAIPNKHDGKSFRRVMQLKDGPQVYGAWILIVQVASKCPKRGTLADDDGPISPEDLEMKTGCPAKIFDRALEVLTSKAVGWMESFELPARSQHAPSTLPARSTEVSLQDKTGQDRTGQDRTLSPTETCPKPPTADSGPPSKNGTMPDVEAIMVFPCVGKGPTEWPLTDAKVSEYRHSYPAVDVLGECRKARQWSIDNPTKRKTFGGMGAFLSRWLAKAQDRAGNENGRLFGKINADDPGFNSGLQALVERHQHGGD